MLKYILNKNRELISDTKDLVIQTSQNVDEIRIQIEEGLELGTGVTPTITFENPKKVNSDEYVMDYDYNNNTLHFLLNNQWFTSVEGIMKFTIRVYDTPNWQNASDDSRILATTKGSYRVESAVVSGITPTIPPTDLEQIYLAIAQKTTPNDVETIVDDILIDENFVQSLSKVNEEITPTTINETHITAIKFDGTEETVAIPLPSGLATEEEAKVIGNQQAQIYYASQNPLKHLQGSTNDLEVSAIRHDGTTESVTVKLPDNMVISFEEQETDEPILEQLYSTAIADAEGNNIVETYATKTELSNESNNIYIKIDDNKTELEGSISDLTTTVSNLTTTVNDNTEKINTYKPITNTDNIDNEKENNSFYVLKDATEPNVYYTQDIVSYVENVEQNPNVITIGTEFEAMYVDDSILDATFSTSYGTGTNINIGTLTWDGSSSVTQNFAINITSEGKIQTLRIGWSYNLISGGSLENQTIIMKNYSSAYEDSTSTTLTIISGYEGLFNELQPYLYRGDIVTTPVYTQKTYELANKEILSTVATTGNYNDLFNTPTTGLVENKTTTNIGTIPSGSYRLGSTTPTAYCIAYNNGINQTTTTIFYGGENCYVPLYTFNDTTQTYDVNFNDYLYIKEYNGMYYLCRSSSNIDWTYCYKIV